MDLLQEARSLYVAGDMHRALEAAQAAADRKPKDAEAWWLLGCISRHVGLVAASDDAFRRAQRLAPRQRPQPFRVAPDRLQELVESAIESLSADSRRRLGGPKLRIAPLPPADKIRSGVSPDALTARCDGELVVYQVNLENRAGDEAELGRLVRRALQRA